MLWILSYSALSVVLSTVKQRLDDEATREKRSIQLVQLCAGEEDEDRGSGRGARGRRQGGQELRESYG